MAKVLLRITYRLQEHNVQRFEVILLDEIIPLVQEMGIHRPTIWKCFVGEAGEFMELWNPGDFAALRSQLLETPESRAAIENELQFRLRAIEKLRLDCQKLRKYIELLYLLKFIIIVIV